MNFLKSLGCLVYLFLLCPIVSANSVIEAKSLATKNPPSTRFFNSEIPIAYRTKIHDYVKSRLPHHPHFNFREKIATSYQQEVENFLRLTLDPLTEKDQRKWHQSFIKTLRNLTHGDKEEASKSSKDTAAFLDDFFIWLFSEVDLSDAYVAMFAKENLNYSIQAFNDRSMATLLGEVYSSFCFQSQYDGYDSKNHDSDPLLDGNMPLLLYHFANGNKQIPLLRSGTMVIDSRRDSQLLFRIDPIFEYYLEALGRKEKRHLFVTLMRYGSSVDPKNSAELLRTETLVQLETRQKSARLIALDKNSDFYFQKGAFSALNQAEDFKSQFLQHLLLEGAEAKFYWSIYLNKEEWQTTLQAIVEKVHSTYFNSQPNLTAAERTTFIELSNLEIIQEAIFQLNPDVVNVACHYGIDRGASLLGLLSFDYFFGHPSESNLQKFMAFLFGPGILFHNRPIHSERIGILEKAVDCLQKSQSN